MDYQTIINQITENILSNIKNALIKDLSDKTFKAQVTESKGNSKYKVKYCGNDYMVSSSISLVIGDYVRVCAPCNNWNDLFVVCKTR